MDSSEIKEKDEYLFKNGEKIAEDTLIEETDKSFKKDFDKSPKEKFKINKRRVDNYGNVIKKGGKQRIMFMDEFLFYRSDRKKCTAINSKPVAKLDNINISKRRNKKSMTTKYNKINEEEKEDDIIKEESLLRLPSFQGRSKFIDIVFIESFKPYTKKMACLVSGDDLPVTLCCSSSCLIY